MLMESFTLPFITNGMRPEHGYAAGANLCATWATGSLVYRLSASPRGRSEARRAPGVGAGCCCWCSEDPCALTDPRRHRNGSGWFGTAHVPVAEIVLYYLRNASQPVSLVLITRMRPPQFD